MNITKHDSTIGGSPERFGYAWNKYSELKPEYEEQFRRWLPFFKPADWEGKRFVDVGCGMGRNSYWPMTYGASGGYAVDVEERSLVVARINLASFPALHAHSGEGDHSFRRMATTHSRAWRPVWRGACEGTVEYVC